jgi:hypothetical protein
MIGLVKTTKTSPQVSEKLAETGMGAEAVSL